MPQNHLRFKAEYEESAMNQTALITAAGGIGDILRITPLVRVFAHSGYAVDVLVIPDYLETVSLLEGAPDVRNLFYLPSAWCKTKAQRLDGLSEQVYDVATFTFWSRTYRNLVRAKTIYTFDQRQWLQKGDSACVKKIAEAKGWYTALPAPFAMTANKTFQLAPNTVAFHTGCKPGWYWKKWHGFEALAQLVPRVALVGTPSDLQNDDTYFRRAFAWPANVTSFVGKLSLLETAALLKECAALVSNDSGLMHLGVAVGIPTFGIFGLTSPEREITLAPNMFPITKGLACEPACRQTPWGRRDCTYHLECLKSLTPQEVFGKITEGADLQISAERH
jgi:ADP-heptose:LPS heptosyltransferase